ncbi:ABC transporter ATP-binding protein [Halomonas halocynthiae]|uniref:ABC transporter ATP-binding protein n=1 Tax=Halomonas halocynthiae TaxID=176290 RepID=UPI00040B8A6F|nr:ABC transporter ATP-binding protein [Halomonas halocynthiae]
MAELRANELVVDIPGRASGCALRLSICAGERWGVLGPNGSGKTTLLHTLAGLRSPRSGHVALDGIPLQQLKRRQVAQALGVVFQDSQIGFPATVHETAMIGRYPWLSPWRRESLEDIALAQAALKRLDLEALSERVLATLSGGERQRVGLATVLTQSPHIWLVDEPTNHLDLHHQVAVMRLLTEQANAGCGVIMCLHDLNLAARWCDQILLLYPDGDACWGPRDTMLEPQALERLYGQKLTTAHIDGAPVFVPVA